MKKFLRLHLNALRLHCFEGGHCLDSKNEKADLHEVALKKFSELDINENKVDLRIYRILSLLSTACSI